MEHFPVKTSYLPALEWMQLFYRQVMQNLGLTLRQGLTGAFRQTDLCPSAYCFVCLIKEITSSATKQEADVTNTRGGGGEHTVGDSTWKNEFNDYYVWLRFGFLLFPAVLH